MRVVLDSNVLISARLGPLGASAGLLRAWTDGRFELIMSPGLVDEVSDVLARPKLRKWLTQDEARKFVKLLRAGATIIDDPPAEAGTTPDPEDGYLVALARVANADYLISGDRHLTGLTHLQPPVLTPRAFVEHLNRQAPSAHTKN